MEQLGSKLASIQNEEWAGPATETVPTPITAPPTIPASAVPTVPSSPRPMLTAASTGTPLAIQSAMGVTQGPIGPTGEKLITKAPPRTGTMSQTKLEPKSGETQIKAPPKNWNHFADEIGTEER